MRLVLVLALCSCAKDPPTPLAQLRQRVEEVTARAKAVIAGAHTDAELRAARHTLVDLQLELADLSERIDRAGLQSRR